MLFHYHYQSLKEVFPCIFISLKIYLTISVANCSAERAFSTLTSLKINICRTTSQTQENLDIQMILYFENDLLKLLDLNEVQNVLRELASSKARKKNVFDKIVFVLYINFH